jgi:hypothetical protein
MFEEELALEQKESSIIPLLLIIALIAGALGVAGYYIMEARKVLTQEQGSQLVSAILKGQGPAAVHFHVGMVPLGTDEKTYDPHYKLLAKAGIITVGKAKGTKIPISLTPAGEKLLAEIPGVKKVQKTDETVYTLPLADRQLVAVNKITMENPTHATVQYTWKWQPNRAGEFFDASQPLVKGFESWDRTVLISKYGADFFHADPKSVELKASKTDSGWGIAPSE